MAGHRKRWQHVTRSRETVVWRSVFVDSFCFGFSPCVLLGVLIIAIVCAVLGCTQVDRSKPKTSAKKSASNTESSASPKPQPSASNNRRNHDAMPRPANDGGRAESPLPRGNTPGPEKVCGHAVAFAGWRPGNAGGPDRLLFFDPADNALEVGRHEHRWHVDPGESSVHFGARRPTVVLEPGKAFTVCGAIVVLPQNDAAVSEPIESAIEAMPDLSQVLGEKWPGLCGPTSAADIVFCMGAHRELLVEGLPSGPSNEAHDAVARLIVGCDDTIDKRSLAFRMGLQDDGLGVTNVGMQRGLKDWLEGRDPGNWTVDLTWLSDAEKTADAQASFFRALESAIRSGGGAILCLWPGAEFGDESVAKADERNASDSAGSGKAATTNSGLSRSSGPNAGSAGAADGTSDGGRSQATQASNGKSQGAQEKGGGTVRPAEQVGNENPADMEWDARRPGAARAENRQVSGVLPGRRSSPEQIEAALEKGKQSLERARKAERKGDTTAALNHLGDAISVLRRHAADERCRQALDEVTEMAVALSQEETDAPPMTNTTTTFE